MNNNNNYRVKLHLKQRYALNYKLNYKQKQ